MTTTKPSTLSREEIECYSRQLILPDWGIRHQAKLQACTLVLDASLLPAARYLAGAGIGQIFLWQENLSAVPAICRSIGSINPHVRIVPAHVELGPVQVTLFPAENFSAAKLFEADKHFTFSSTADGVELCCTDRSNQRAGFQVERPQLARGLSQLQIDSLLAALFLIQTIGKLPTAS